MAIRSRKKSISVSRRTLGLSRVLEKLGISPRHKMRSVRLSPDFSWRGQQTDYNDRSAMRIFLTGATGYIGSAVLDALLRGGHHVTALVRDPEKAERVSLRSVQPVIGDLSKPKTYAAAADACDGIVHTAFEYSKRGQTVDCDAI